MWKKMNRVLIFVILLFSLWKTYAWNAEVEKVYDTFLSQIEARYSTEVQSALLLKVRDFALRYSNATKDNKKKEYIQEMLLLNNEALYELWKKQELSQTIQKTKELQARLLLEKKLSSIQASSSAQEIMKETWSEYIPLNTEREFVRNSDIFRVEYSQYFPVNKDNISALKKKDWIIIQEEGEERFIESYSFQKKIPYSELAVSFAGFFTPHHKIIENNNNYYAYNFSNFHFYDDDYWAYQNQLDASGFKKESTFVYRDENGRYNFVTQYGAHGLIPQASVFWVPGKELFLDALREDSKYQTLNKGDYLSQIQKITLSLTEGMNQEEKIQSIYAWILENISYSSDVRLDDEKIFSGVETFKNNEGVCTGYTKLMLYMLFYAGIYDVEVIRGHVIDAADFPQIGHAWVRIWDKYYDPTLDDPIGLKTVRDESEYKYFWLPKDIFYANRFEYDELPDSFATASKTEISNYIYSTLSSLLPKYKWQISQYKVFTPIEFRNSYNILNTTRITPDLLAAKIWSFAVADNSFRFTEDGISRRISNIRYYVLTDENTEKVLEVLNYDIADFYLFDWEISSGQREWRLAYELELK